MTPNTVATRSLIERDVVDALTRWERRIQLRNVSVVPGADPALVFIAISYVHVRDGRPGNFVYPFYLE
jgi:phage baseplate assembly protein W